MRRVYGMRRGGGLGKIDRANGGRPGRWERHQAVHGAQTPVVVAAPEVIIGGLHQSPLPALHRVGDVVRGSSCRLGRHENGREISAIVRRARLCSRRAGNEPLVKSKLVRRRVRACAQDEMPSTGTIRPCSCCIDADRKAAWSSKGTAPEKSMSGWLKSPCYWILFCVWCGVSGGR